MANDPVLYLAKDGEAIERLGDVRSYAFGVQESTQTVSNIGFVPGGKATISLSNGEQLDATYTITPDGMVKVVYDPREVDDGKG